MQGVSQWLHFPCCALVTSVAHEIVLQTSFALFERCPATDSSIATLLPIAAFLDSGEHFLTSQLCVKRWNRVSNEVAHGVHLVGEEAVVLGKRLEQGRFTDGDGVSAFVRVPEPTLTRSRASTRDGR